MRTLLKLLPVLLVAELAIAQNAKTPQLPSNVELLADLTYKEVDGIDLLLDLYRPKDYSGKLPVVVWVHGGGWKNGSKKKCKAAWLTEKGYAVASINYRLTDVAQWPAQIDDCHDSVRWLKSKAEKYGLDAEKIGVWGSSAGGHLVALMGTRPTDEGGRIHAVCDWFGPTELLTMPPNNVGNGRTEEDIAKSNGAKLLGATVRDVPDLARDASALDHVSSDDVPFLIMHGSEDPGVPLEQSTKFHEKLKSVGVESTLEILEGAGHGGPLFNTPAAKRSVEEFFDKHLKD